MPALKAIQPHTPCIMLPNMCSWLPRATRHTSLVNVRNWRQPCKPATPMLHSRPPFWISEKAIWTNSENCCRLFRKVILLWGELTLELSFSIFLSEVEHSNNSIFCCFLLTMQQKTLLKYGQIQLNLLTKLYFFCYYLAHYFTSAPSRLRASRDVEVSLIPPPFAGTAPPLPPSPLLALIHHYRYLSSTTGPPFWNWSPIAGIGPLMILL